ncbi:efflux transporter outer membrane subunit [Variovorax ginsengisoli]|uniref:NodT family efflux transporter outer membrane factor (OMF) lipoprotein n=1 Tax=Variovorax ginsengisoli TaxID=363844 RepID=A0ABT9SCM6_9BURK|nr:efflux transporter outer membrane subunit [Variovorax ginsengisoli]MDP9902084.1 NodT family efflux transporter outer membrane factor (OMF) lipoprotein [Variovorax ginsengisoli]
MLTPSHFLALSALALLLGGCAAGPDYARPPLQLPDRYGATSAPAAGAEGADLPAQWWTAFHSEALNTLVAQSLAANPTLEAADAALRGARELVAAEQAGFWPSVSLNYTPTRQRVADTVSSPVASNANLYTLHTAQLNVSYTPDVFGATRRQVENTQAQAENQRFQSLATRVTLTSNVVAAAIADASLRAQRTATLEIIGAQRKMLDAYRQQLRLGQVAPADVDAQETQLAATEATLPPIERQVAQQRNLLAVLTGRYPSQGIEAQLDLDTLQLPTVLPLSLPSTLVEHRPDVRAAEAQLKAASAAIGMAVAARLPSVTLGGNVGSSAYTLSQLFTGPGMFWTLVGSATQPLFDAGALEHREAAARASFDQAGAQYRATVLGAFQDVANTLAAIDTDAKAVEAAQKADRLAAQALARLQLQLRAGDASMLSLRLAHQSHQQARLGLIQARALQLSDAAALFQALGGGWWNLPDESDAKAHPTAVAAAPVPDPGR